MTPCLAITMGDPAGVGPEIIVKACRRLLPRIEAGGLRLMVIGHRSALEAARALLGETLAFADDADAGLSFVAAGEEMAPIRFGSRVHSAARLRISRMARWMSSAVTRSPAGTPSTMTTRARPWDSPAVRKRSARWLTEFVALG